jgi:hypothetical protein
VLIPEENTSWHLLKGDVAFIRNDPRERYANPRGISEVVWGHDRFCQPRVPGRMTPEYPNVFDEFTGDASAFFKACGDTFYGGRKPVTISGLET